ncbi:osmoprotectant transport system ATP-binding protein [Tistlia consotensis]|uniref:Osmoprotectant transport system ATP-binding protein n=1 Tax=Tistlia consotensis USBA 355 TaxID=560819 RepID=A0A1Y6B3Z6_9PROT|nr:ABC transporter ATP-binding protein [Tistlia consotensis]SME88813.1 osmoprotectant transport system ATP-binding protein [Tistlia consotensis USBA 355]SNR25353.1 osmoprotectant transport system ATP-binding protein [Tistlia consotensis]
MTEALRLEQVAKRYGASTAVRDATFSVAEGEFCAIVGPSGCGKTTTLKMINRVIEPTAGRILVEGVDAAAIDAVQLRRRIGYVIQQIGLFPHMTVEDNVSAVLRITGRPRAECRQRAHEMLERVGLPPGEYARRRPAALSGGQQQRVGVARALAADPEVILMDEPFAAVDPLIRKQLQDELARIQRETRKTVVFVTHDLPEAFRLADRIVVFKDGAVVQAGTPEELLFAPATPFVSDYLAESRELLGLHFVRARDFGRPATVERPDLPAEASLLEVLRALAAGRREARTIALGAAPGGNGWLLEPADLVRGIAAAVAPPG